MKAINLITTFVFMSLSIQSAHAYRIDSYDNTRSSQGANQSQHSMQEISVDGQFSNQKQYQAPRPQRQKRKSDQLRNKRAQLEKQNERMIREKIEEIRYQKEAQLMKQMQETMNQTMEAMGNIGS